MPAESKIKLRFRNHWCSKCGEYGWVISCDVKIDDKLCRRSICTMCLKEAIKELLWELEGEE